MSDLHRPRSREQVVQRMLLALSSGTVLDPVNFAPTNYIPGDPLRTLLEIAGEGVADIERLVWALGEGGYLETAQGSYLDELVESHYLLSRQGSTFARGQVRFYAAAQGGMTLPAGMIVGTAYGLKYVTTAEAAVEAGGSADVPIHAESPGTAYNVPAGTITQIHTPLPGLSVANLPGWLLEAGADEESDASLRRRASLRWASLGGGATRAAYEYWALTASPAVDRVAVLDQHPRGQGTADVVIWGTGGIGADVVREVNDSIQQRRPVTADIAVYAATERVVPVSIELYAPLGDRASIEAQVMAGLSALQRELGIGGTLYQAAVVEVAMLPAGVLDARVGMTDLKLGRAEAATLAPTISWRGTP
ncbi:baseplate J/gp47 family protein [Deinococcus lacus]|uniref:Baseplate J/gp47 family protein n=1 Tax=Deinococcus lacus TaxID=392561 RepID=A0ABW1YDK7_9DEIO